MCETPPKTTPRNFQNATHFKIMRKMIIILINNNNNNNNIHDKMLLWTLHFSLYPRTVQDNETRFQNSRIVTYKKKVVRKCSTKKKEKEWTKLPCFGLNFSPNVSGLHGPSSVEFTKYPGDEIGFVIIMVLLWFNWFRVSCISWPSHGTLPFAFSSSSTSLEATLGGLMLYQLYVRMI